MTWKYFNLQACKRITDGIQKTFIQKLKLYFTSTFPTFQRFLILVNSYIFLSAWQIKEGMCLYQLSPNTCPFKTAKKASIHVLLMALQAIHKINRNKSLKAPCKSRRYQRIATILWVSLTEKAKERIKSSYTGSSSRGWKLNLFTVRLNHQAKHV